VSHVAKAKEPVHFLHLKKADFFMFPFNLRFWKSRKNEHVLHNDEESRLNAMVSNISDVVGIIDKDGIIRYNSSNITSLFGWESQEVLGATAWDFVHPDDIEDLREIFVQTLKTPGEPASFKFRLRQKNGDHVMVSMTAINLINNPYIRGILFNYHSIEEIERRTCELRDSEERFKTLHNASFGGITIHDHGVIMDCNKGLSDITGYSLEELIGMDGLLLIAEESRDFVRNQIATGYVKAYESMGVRKNGEKYPIRLEAKHIPYKGKMVRVVEFRDITEQKQVEQEIRKKNEELAQSLEKIQKINTELEAAKERAEESDRLKTAFLCNLSHEIRTPMNGILGFADLLDGGNVCEIHQKRYIELIQESGQRMLNLINDLVDISQIETGQIKIHEKETQLNALMDHTFDFFLPLAEKRNLNFTLEKGLQDNDSTLLTDPVRLEQVLTNLLGNAIKFTKEGYIHFGYKTDGTDLYFWVKDSGIGIPQEMHDVVFQRFRQVDDTFFREEEGSGLGLSISKSIVELMNGTIGVSSEQGHGAEFFFRIPFNQVNNVAHSENARTSPAAVRDGSGITILIAEDDELNYTYLYEVLKSDDTTLIRAHNGKEAVEALQENPSIDLILMDIKMPILNGYDATRQIREMNPDIPIIAQTAYASNSDRRRALGVGCDDLVSKPIDRKVLMKSIHKCLA